MVVIMMKKSAITFVADRDVDWLRRAATRATCASTRATRDSKRATCASTRASTLDRLA